MLGFYSHRYGPPQEQYDPVILASQFRRATRLFYPEIEFELMGRNGYPTSAPRDGQVQGIASVNGVRYGLTGGISASFEGADCFVQRLQFPHLMPLPPKEAFSKTLALRYQNRHLFEMLSKLPLGHSVTLNGCELVITTKREPATLRTLKEYVDRLISGRTAGATFPDPTPFYGYRCNSVVRKPTGYIASYLSETFGVDGQVLRLEQSFPGLNAPTQSDLSQPVLFIPKRLVVDNRHLRIRRSDRLLGKVQTGNREVLLRDGETYMRAFFDERTHLITAGSLAWKIEVE
jgi:hypothetical protein